jgi:hypothetical protein
MLPRPATIATAPSTASPASWNPAVAPPPVTGAPMGAELDDGLEAGWGLALCDADGLALVLALADELGLVLALALVLVRGEEPPLAVLVAVELTVELVPAEGMNVDGGGVEAGLEVQAESATQASMVVRPQPTTVSRTRCDVHAMAVRALIEPPRVLGNDHFPVASRRNEESTGDLNVEPKRWHKQAMACSPSEY